ncbi:MAG: hypothetical protein M3340_06680 [Actinomycetota bacterium]|nr:hypothetical protein [Actinomycetota bacterium]
MRPLKWGILVAAACALFATPAAAAPTWSEPQAISPPGALDIRTAMDAGGNALVTWGVLNEDRTTAGYYRWWLAGRGWAEVRRIPRKRVVQGLAMTPLGEAQVVVQERPDHPGGPLFVATAKPGEALDGFEQVTATAAPSGVAFGADDAGNAILAWVQSGDAPVLYVATRRAGGKFSEPLGLETHVGARPIVAVNAAGAAVVAWGSNLRGGVAAAYRPPGGSFGPNELAISEHSYPQDIGIDTAGRAVVTGHEPIFAPGPETRARYAVRSALDEWSDPRSIDAEGLAAGMFVEPRGTITFMTVHESERDRYEHRAFTLMPDGSLARETVASGAAGWPKGAMDLRGDILHVFQRSTAAGGYELVARERGFAQFAFGPEALVAPMSNRSYAFAPASNDLGQAIVAWAELPLPGEPWKPGPVRVAIRDDPALRDLPLPPDVDLYADPLATLDPDGDLSVPIRCDQDCKAIPTGIVFPGAGRDAVAGRGGSKRLRRAKRGRVLVDFGAAGARAVREAQAAGAKPWVSVSVRARGRSPRPLLVSRRYRLR